MRNIFLAGGGSAEDSRALDTAFAAALPANPNILYIPIALDEPYNRRFDWINGALSPLGIRHITMWTSLEDCAGADLSRFDAVYIGGGNTYKLLREVRESGFENALLDYAGNGGVIYGGSAGAIILGKDISTASHLDTNHITMEATVGLNLAGDLDIWCHYTPSDHNLIKTYIEYTRKSVIAISERGGIHLTDSEAHVIGDSVVFYGPISLKAYKPGSRFRL